MANPDDESKSDGLEILSVGALYTGDWDKKYWSSSRGKDRYPYPIGYQALRTHKGITYKMEILEGSKGPIFQITSNDKQFGSGETPERAWENFQKKCCSRTKLWHGKRHSGKLDGVEFFGFKNALVQRLLRELVATVNDASDCSSVFSNCNEASSKGKRSKRCRIIDTKSACKSGHRRSQPPHKSDNATMSYSAPGETLTDGSPFCALNDYHADEASKVLSNLRPRKNLPSRAHGSPSMSQDVPAHSNTEALQAQIECPNRETCAAASSFVVGFPLEEKPFDRSHVQAKGVGTSAATEERNQEMQVLPDLQRPLPLMPRDSQVNYYSSLIVPDTYDTQQEITCDINSDNQGEQAMARDEPLGAYLVSEEKISESRSEEGSHYLDDNSEKSDFHSCDEDITKTMLSILLPRAVPYLTYSSRKKRRKTKPTKDLSCASKDNNLDEAIPSADVKSAAGELDSSNTDGQKTSHISGVIDSSPSTTNLVVPDSLDNDHCEDLVEDKLPPLLDNGESVAVNLQEEKELDNKRSSAVFDATESCSHENKFVPSKKAFSHEEQQKNFDGMPLMNCVPALHTAISGPPPVLVDLVAESENLYQNINTDGSLKPIDHSPKSTDLDITPDLNGSRFPPVSGKQQSSINEHSKVGTYGAPLSESIICRNTQDSLACEMHYSPVNFELLNSSQDNVSGDGDKTEAPIAEGKVEGHNSHMLNQTVKDALAQICELQEQPMDFTINNSEIPIIEGFNGRAKQSEGYIENDMRSNQNLDPIYQLVDQLRDHSGSHFREEETETKSSCGQELCQEIKGNMKFIGCYSHPMQISSIMLTRKPHEIYICVSCGFLGDRKKDLFLYKLITNEYSLGSPSMVGHTSISLPSLKDEFGTEVAVDKSALQFTPDGRGLALVDSIRMPYCREKNLHCSCLQCESCCFEENAVKIVQVKHGFVSILVKLHTMFPVHCVLVCEPEHLIALDESGRIYIWIMNSAWSVQTESYVIPSYEFLPSRIVDLKRIPNSASMLVGHNGYGEFSLWDIIKRSVVSRFSAPASSVVDYLPVSLFSWPRASLTQDKVAMEGCMRGLQEATMSCFSSEAHISCPKEGEDVAVWLFMCTSSESYPQSACYTISNHLALNKCWRLGLMIKDVVILGAALDSSITAVGISSGTGIVGTQAGQVYIWNLAKGSKQEALCYHKGHKVLHIATDGPTSSVVAIARENGELCVYLQT